MSRVTITIKMNGGYQEVERDLDSCADLLYDLGFEVEAVKSGADCAKVNIQPSSPNQLDLGKHIFDMAAAMNRVMAAQYTAPLKGDQS